MKPTRYGKANFKHLFPLIEGMHGTQPLSNVMHRRFTAGALMPLIVEELYRMEDGRTVFSLTHYGEMNGDLMRDPDMELAVDFQEETVEPLSFTNDYMGIYRVVYTTGEDGRQKVKPHLRSDLDDFLRQWLRNIEDSGYQLENSGYTA